MSSKIFQRVLRCTCVHFAPNQHRYQQPNFMLKFNWVHKYFFLLLLPYYLPRRQHLLHVCIKFYGNSDATRVVQNFPKKMKGYVFISLSISYIKILSHHISRRCRKCDKQVNKKLPSVLIESQEPQFTVFFLSSLPEATTFKYNRHKNDKKWLFPPLYAR